jgi:hypothetical protein
LKEVFEGNLKWVFDDDIDVEDSDWLRSGSEEKWDPAKRWRGEGEAIRFLVDRFVIDIFFLLRLWMICDSFLFFSFM